MMMYLSKATFNLLAAAPSSSSGVHDNVSRCSTRTIPALCCLCDSIVLKLYPTTETLSQYMYVAAIIAALTIAAATIVACLILLGCVYRSFRSPKRSARSSADISSMDSSTPAVHVHVPSSPGDAGDSPKAKDNDSDSSTVDESASIADSNSEDDATEEGAEEKTSLLVLLSTVCLDRTQALNQRRALNLLEAKRMQYDVVDGCDPGQLYVRNELFKEASLSGSGSGMGSGIENKNNETENNICYPQFFLVGQAGSIVHVGDYKRLEEINEASGLPKEVLRDHPEIETWDEVFRNLVSPDDIYQR